MKKSFYWLLFIPVLLLAGGWTWRYISLNQYYEGISDSTQVVYSIGESVQFGEDYIDYKLTADGYSIRIDDFVIVNADKLSDMVEIDTTQLESVPDRIALVSITVMNEGSTAVGVPLTELELYGVDEWLFAEYELLDLMNPVLEGNSGISLADGTSYQVVLPYGLYENRFSNYSWNHMDHYELFLQVTTHPTRKIVKLQ